MIDEVALMFYHVFFSFGLLFGFPIFRLWGYLMEIIPETQYIRCLRFDYNQWVETTTGGLVILEDIIQPIVSASTLTWFIRYIYVWKLQFLDHVIIIKTEVNLPQA
jgi:hypothetical protein